MGITHANRDGKSVKNISRFLWAYIKNLDYFQNLNYVFEGAYFDINDLRQMKDKYTIILLIHGLNAEEIFANIKTHDTIKDWTSKKSNKELLEYCKHLEKMDKYYEKERDVDMLIFRTGKDREKTFQRIINQLKIIQEKD